MNLCSFYRSKQRRPDLPIGPAGGMNHWLKEMEKRRIVWETSKKNKDNIAQVRKKVENIKERLERRMNTNKDVIFEEMRERKAKRFYIVMHGVQECNEKIKRRERGWSGARTRQRRYSNCWSLAFLKKKSNTATGLVKKQVTKGKGQGQDNVRKNSR